MERFSLGVLSVCYLVFELYSLQVYKCVVGARVSQGLTAEVEVNIGKLFFPCHMIHELMYERLYNTCDHLFQQQIVSIS